MIPTLNLKPKFIANIHEQFPALSVEQIEPLVSDNLLSPFQIELPSALLTQAQQFVDAIFSLRTKPAYLQKFSEIFSSHNLQVPGNFSILMSYDFHVDENGLLKLIEINTNAAFLALGDSLYRTIGLAQPIPSFSMQEIRKNILEELSLNGKAVASPSLAIIDDKPQEQRLFLEFLVFAEYFKSWGWSTEICDYRNLKTPVDFIYNRYTDFLFNDQSSKHLKDLFNSRQSTVSPQPIEYILLADKTRMMEWNEPDFLSSYGLEEEQIKIVKKTLPICQVLNSSNAEETWSKRKNLFFKPRQSFGSKQSYKGAKISRKLFDEIAKQDFISQSYIPAAERRFETPEGPQDFKYDLRFYVYKNRVQSVIARVYQGQVTNLQTRYGGFAGVRFI